MSPTNRDAAKWYSIGIRNWGMSSLGLKSTAEEILKTLVHVKRRRKVSRRNRVDKPSARNRHNSRELEFPPTQNM